MPSFNHSPQHNNNQDLAYARMVLTRLLEFTDPEGVHRVTARDGDRSRWALLLDNLVAFPLIPAPDGSGLVFAEAETDDSLNQPPADSNLNYPIAHLAAVFPAQVTARLAAVFPPQVITHPSEVRPARQAVIYLKVWLCTCLPSSSIYSVFLAQRATVRPPTCFPHRSCPQTLTGCWSALPDAQQSC